MGIKFHCPQGHKLNVKSFLAGKKGRCPKCGTKVRIPSVSEPALKDSEIEESDADDPAASGNGSAIAAAMAPIGAAIAAPPTSSPAATEVRPQVAAPPAAAPHSAVSAADPITEAPAAVWYVRPPSGGEYGPARGEIMRRWIEEGRVSSDSLVWREGWADWRGAGQIFPSLQAAGALPITSTMPRPIPAYATQATNRYQTKQRVGRGRSILVVVALVIAIVALAAVFAWVVLA